MLHLAASSNEIFGNGPIGRLCLGRWKARCRGSGTNHRARMPNRAREMAADYPAGVIAGLWRVRYNRWFVCRSERAN